MTISVIIPVFNEYDTINSVISELKDCEIIVSDCNGATIEQVSDKNIIKVQSVKGRGVQMNSGAELASNEVLLFLHADTKLPANWQQSVNSILNSADYGAFSLGIDSKRPIFRIIEFFSNLRCRITKIPYGDQAIFMKKHCFCCFPDYPIFEDFTLMRNLKKKGYKFKLSDEKVKTSARRWDQEGILYTTFRNLVLTMRYLWGEHPAELKKYYGDKR